MDETACWMHLPGNSTSHTSGSGTVSLKTTGHKKDHFTVAPVLKLMELLSQNHLLFSKERELDY
uniref:DDE-1 domain-containing protein n=1 Tax=Amphimedon queenslandica TaxID=400682 RepID=A0A1X7VHR1_AMPQE